MINLDNNINEILNNKNNMYYGHGIGKEEIKIIDSIINNGIRCSHGSLYYTTITLGIGGKLDAQAENSLKKWPHKESDVVVIASLPINYHILETNELHTYNKRYSSFYYIPSQEQIKDSSFLTDSFYLMPEFIVGYYDAKKNAFHKNPQYYENLSTEEQEKLFQKIKENYYTIIEESCGIEKYKSILKVLKKDFPLKEEDIETIKKNLSAKKEQDEKMEVDTTSSVSSLINGKNIKSEYFKIQYRPSNDGSKLKLKCDLLLLSMAGADIHRKEKQILILEETFLEALLLCQTEEEMINFKKFIQEMANVGGYAQEFYEEKKDFFSIENKKKASEELQKLKEKKKEPVSKINDNQLESKYFNIKYRPKNTNNIEEDCNRFLQKLAVADATRTPESIKNLHRTFSNLLLSCNTPEDFLNLNTFLDVTADIGGLAIDYNKAMKNYLKEEGKEKATQFINQQEEENYSKEII